MAIDTLEKRYASLTFGSAGRAGTREPAGSSSAFRRAAALGIYGGGGEVTATSISTTQMVLFGTSLVRPVLMGTTTERMTLMGSNPS